MTFSKEIADKILEFAALEPTIPVGVGHDFQTDAFDQNDVLDTAKYLISTGQIKAKIENHYYNGLVNIAFRQ
ncbi:MULTISPECIES: hypothetical protein [Streptococcus]|uniref:Uncharacterized protein n=1 Tax=Streptococcus canis TaxID=1329 RepID=A0AAE4TQV9_STRCB|nr:MULTISPECIES: hypothetical protein [Streptococcus]MDV5976218.1 hypothetical protein [Streptococcus canis]